MGERESKGNTDDPRGNSHVQVLPEVSDKRQERNYSQLVGCVPGILTLQETLLKHRGEDGPSGGDSEVLFRNNIYRGTMDNSFTGAMEIFSHNTATCSLLWSSPRVT